LSRILAVILALLVLVPSPARAEWFRAESPNFIVYGEMARDRLRERVILLEEFDAFLRLLTGTADPPAPNKLRVYLVHGGLEMSLVAPVGPGIGGFYRATAEGVALVADEYTNWRQNEDDTLLHEYAHHFMMQYHPAPYPTWYVEGFADYVSTASITPRRIEYGNYNLIRASWLTGATNWIPYEEILFGRLRNISLGSYYAQSWVLVHYIMADERRRAAFVRYVQALGRGEEPRPAFAAAFGVGPAELDRTLRDYSRRITFHRINRTGPPPAPPIAITRLGSQGLNPPLLEASLLLDTSAGNRARILDRARRAGRDEDDYGRRLWVRAEILLGDPGAADPMLDRLLAAAPADPELLYLKGLRHLVTGRRDAVGRAAEYRRAGEFFARAIRADPNYWQALFHYAETLPPDRLLSDNSRNILILASQLAPQVIDIRLAAAHLLLLRGEFEQAEAMLLPIAPTVHDPDAGDRALEFLRLARARQRPDDTIVFKTGTANMPAS
jgi:tetratricopeptide (TPR) repeat protein